MPITSPLAISFVAVAITSLPFAGEKTEDPFDRFELPGGVRLVVWQVEDAPKQSTFTFLPVGLATDSSKQAQYAHLLEHMIIRSTDPKTLKTPGISFNGETTAGALRVESYSEPDQWQKALDRHLQWMQLPEIDAQVFKREKGRIQGEEEHTVTAGYTHKWAQAAWNQVIRHGLSHANVHGDVVNASPEKVLAFAANTFAKQDQFVIASVGPVEPAKIRDWLATRIKEQTAENKTKAPSPLKLAQGTKEATWDLPAFHHMEWRALPNRSPSDRIAGEAVAQLLNMGLYGNKDLEPGRTLVSIMVIPEGRFLMFSANVANPEAAKQASAIFQQLLDTIPTKGRIPLPLALAQLKFQAQQVPDPGPMRKQFQRMQQDTSLLEAQLLLTSVMREWQLGLTFDQIQSAWEPIDADWMKAYVEKIAKAGSPSSLLLTPK
ncbi:MAG: insulinase family protein [bacterium]|nr:insulinase family protein [bacterium]